MTLASNPDRQAHTSDPYSERVTSLGGVRQQTQRGWVHAWKVTDGPVSGAPRPFGAKGIPAAVAVPAMLVVTLSALVASLASITANADNRGWIIAAVIGLFGLWCLLLATPALARSARTASSERSSR